MTDDDLTGPWILALGTLAIGVGAAVRLLRQQRPDDETTPERDGERGR